MLVAATLLFMIAISAVFVTLPYVSVRPGSAQEARELINVEKAASYPPKGKFLLTTVTLRRVNAYEVLDAWLDPDVDAEDALALIQPVPPGVSGGLAG